MPKIYEKLAMFFPSIHLAFILISLFGFLKLLNWQSFIFLLLVIYAFPLILWNFVKKKYPIRKGFEQIGLNSLTGNSWIVAHRLQYLFLTFPAFEKILFLVPGVFSFWLRLWGSRIGKKVVWTPRVEIVDRTDIEIGSYSFIGDHAYLSCHFIVRKNNKLVLFYDQVSIGEKVLIGAHCHLGPGARIQAQEFLPTYSKVMRGKYIKGNEGGHEL